MDVIETLRSNGVSVADTGQRTIETVSFPDDRLAAFFGDVFARRGQEVTTQGLATFVELKLKNDGIQNLAGLEHLINLKELDLSGNQLKELMPIAELRSLTRLTLSKNNLADVSALSRLTLLRRLELDENTITDLFPLINLPRLEFVDLSDNLLTDITPLTWRQANVVVDRNLLDVTPGSRSWSVIDHLISEGHNVAFEPQVRSEPVAVTFEASGETCTTSWPTEAGTFYAVWTSEDLVDWQSSALLEGSGAAMSFALTCRPTTLPRQFVRVVKYVE